MKKLLLLIMAVCSIGLIFPISVRAQEDGQSEGGYGIKPDYESKIFSGGKDRTGRTGRGCCFL